MPDNRSQITVQNLDMVFGEYVVQRNVSFRIRRGTIFIIMGPSGSGKSTLLKSMIGLVRPASGKVLYDGRSLWDADEDERLALSRRFGVLFQSGALWSSMTIAENVQLPLTLQGRLSPRALEAIASFKLSLVGLGGFENFYPSQISGGMRKRAGLARAIVLDPDILFFDEPSAGLDPISARRMDDLILQLRSSLGATVIMVTHDLASIFAVADDAVFLDTEAKTATAQGDPRALRDHSDNSTVREFLTRGELGGHEGSRAPAAPHQER